MTRRQRGVGNPSAWGCGALVLAVVTALAVAVLLTAAGVISWS